MNKKKKCLKNVKNVKNVNNKKIVQLHPKQPLQPRRKTRLHERSVLRFTPYAWAKLQWFCHQGDTEIGGFGITEPDDLLLIRDFVTVKQQVSSASVSFDDEAVADFFDQQVDLGRKPEQFARIWLHTHPGDSPQPSSIDEETFGRVFGNCQWAVMFILARTGNTYARLRFNVGPTGQAIIPVEVDYTQSFGGAVHMVWEHEYKTNIHAEVFTAFGTMPTAIDELDWDEQWLTQLDPEMDQDELEQLARANGMSPDELEQWIEYENEVIL